MKCIPDHISPRLRGLDLESTPGFTLVFNVASNLDRQMGTHFGIGEASRRSGVTPDTLRYYERIGLLPAVGRNAGGQRRYGPEQVARLRFIRRAQAMDFSLDEIGELLELRDADGDVRADVRALAGRKLAAINTRIDALTALRDELAGLIAACSVSERDCPIIGRMNDPSQDG